MPTKETISVREAARRLGISERSAYKAAHEGRLPVLMFGSRIVIPVVAFERFMERAGRTSPDDLQEGASTSASM